MQIVLIAPVEDGVHQAVGLRVLETDRQHQGQEQVAIGGVQIDEGGLIDDTNLQHLLPKPPHPWLTVRHPEHLGIQGFRLGGHGGLGQEIQGRELDGGIGLSPEDGAGDLIGRQIDLGALGGGHTHGNDGQQGNDPEHQHEGDATLAATSPRQGPAIPGVGDRLHWGWPKPDRGTGVVAPSQMMRSGHTR